MNKCDNCPIIDGECNQAMCDQTQANYKRMSQTAANLIEQDIMKSLDVVISSETETQSDGTR